MATSIDQSVSQALFTSISSKEFIFLTVNRQLNDKFERI